jgi:hypothetical protein
MSAKVNPETMLKALLRIIIFSPAFFARARSSREHSLPPAKGRLQPQRSNSSKAAQLEELTVALSAVCDAPADSKNVDPKSGLSLRDKVSQSRV